MYKVDLCAPITSMHVCVPAYDAVVSVVVSISS